MPVDNPICTKCGAKRFKARMKRLDEAHKREMKSLKAFDQLHRYAITPDKQSMNMSGSGFPTLNEGLTIDGHDESKSV